MYAVLCIKPYILIEYELYPTNPTGSRSKKETPRINNINVSVIYLKLTYVQVQFMRIFCMQET